MTRKRFPSAFDTSWTSTTCTDTSQDVMPLETSNLALEDQVCGWLWMREARFGRWRHRYFCLDGAMLSCFATFPAEVFLSQAASSSCPHPVFPFGETCQPCGVVRVVHVDDTNRSLRTGFKVYGACGKVLDIRAPDAKDRNRWLRALKTPARRKSRSWVRGGGRSDHDVTLRLSSFDLDGFCRFDRLSIPIVKSGWMDKRRGGGWLGLWRRYFFVLQGTMLSYYLSDRPYEVPRWRGYVHGVKTRRRRAAIGGASCELMIVMEKAKLRVRLATVQEAREWHYVLRTCVPNELEMSTRTA